MKTFEDNAELKARVEKLMMPIEEFVKIYLEDEENECKLFNIQK